MKKILLFIFIMMIILSSYDIFAAGGGGGGRVIKRAQTSQERAEVQQAQEVQQKVIDLSQGLKCGNLASREERVRCRLNLEDEEYARENELSYLPEECRDLTGERKNNCISLYKKTQRCWQFPVGESRLQCVRENLNLGRSLSAEIRNCDARGTERAKCISDVREKAFSLIKFRFYDLEERAEKLAEEEKVSNDDIVLLVTKLEDKKVEFNNAATIAQKRAIVLEVRQVWKEFVKKVRR